MTRHFLQSGIAQAIHQPQGYISPDLPDEPPPEDEFAPVWISNEDLMSRPNSGAIWDAVNNRATGALGTANVSDQDSSHSRNTLAAAYVGVRNNDSAMITKATDALTAAIGTESDARWLAVGRNLGAYIIAADVLDIRSGPIYNWIASFRTIELEDNNNALITEPFNESAWASGSNASAQEGFVYSALCVYIEDQDELDWNWMAFRRYCGDRTSTHTITSNNDSWQEIPADPVGIQNLGALATNGANIDGVVSNDMARSNAVATNTPVYNADSLYPWVGLNGAGFAALVLHRQGYPAFECSDNALERAFTYLHTLGGQWYDGTEKPDIKWILNVAYGLTYDVVSPVGRPSLIGYTDWSHPTTV
jgi:hypothetical protein